MKESHVDIGPLQMHVRDNEADGFPLLFVHGLTFDGTMWGAQEAALGETYRTLAVDVRGHGRTKWASGETTVPDMADDLARVLDALGVEKVGAVGLSMGGMLCQLLALRHPDRVAALALLNTTCESEEESKRDMYDQINERTRGKPSDENTVAFILALMFSPAFMEKNPEVVKPYHDLLMDPYDDEGLYWSGKAWVWRDGIEDRLAEIRRPTLVVVSDTDMALAAPLGERIAEGIAGARLHRVAESGHLSAVEHADEISTLLADFFAEALS